MSAALFPAPIWSQPAGLWPQLQRCLWRVESSKGSASNTLPCSRFSIPFDETAPSVTTDAQCNSRHFPFASLPSEMPILRVMLVKWRAVLSAGYLHLPWNTSVWLLSLGEMCPELPTPARACCSLAPVFFHGRLCAMLIHWPLLSDKGNA